MWAYVLAPSSRSRFVVNSYGEHDTRVFAAIRCVVIRP
jgi:hypothetical protein